MGARNVWNLRRKEYVFGNGGVKWSLDRFLRVCLLLLPPPSQVLQVVSLRLGQIRIGRGRCVDVADGYCWGWLRFIDRNVAMLSEFRLTVFLASVGGNGLGDHLLGRVVGARCFVQKPVVHDDDRHCRIKYKVR